LFLGAAASVTQRANCRKQRSWCRAAAQQEKAMLADIKGPTNLADDMEGLPWWWELFWQLPFTARGKPGEPINLGDTMHVFRLNIEQIFGGEPSYDGAPLATGDLASSGLTDGTMYLGLQKYQKNFGDVYKLCFGPKSFMVVSDPVMVRHILRENVFNYDKGVLGEVLEDVMGKGLIPADFELWKVRRKAIVPGFHKAWLDYQVGQFGKAGSMLTKQLHQAAAESKVVDMEERFGSVALDIIGKAVFNYEFGSCEGESPVVKAAIQSLREVEHRAQTPFQYWKLPFMDVIVERQREFKENMELLNGALNKCVEQALKDRSEADVEELELRDYSKMDNPSLLRFLVDMRGEATSGKQLRDDMITMLIAGHETTASALTWALFELAQQPELLARVQQEIDEVMGEREFPTYEDVKNMELVRLCFSESLRMYPEPPLLIRRALEEDMLPAGATGKETKVLRGMDFFVSVYNLQRSEKYWPNPNKFDPDRFRHPYKNPEVPDWKGYDPAKWKGQLYPNELACDYAFMPFGAGPRKCVGDAFALLEGSVTLAMVLRGFTFEFAAPTANPSDVGTSTGATIHTKNGLWMKCTARK
jgi:cytochrome P450